MLVLSRHRGESIMIGDPPKQVLVRVHRISGNRVWLSLEADRDVRIWRAELTPFVPQEEKPAAAS